MAGGPQIGDFLAGETDSVLVEVADAKGSTPRDREAWMAVTLAATFGTIGGGQLEFLAIARARDMIAGPGPDADIFDVALGPEIGQCCGGRMQVSLRRLDGAGRAELTARAEREVEQWPAAFLFGGGHVGKALAAALALLPIRTTLVETRPDALDGMPEGVDLRLVAMPEEAVRAAPSGSAFVVLTHDHALDFLIVAEALKRPDAAYVGMIGSRTKVATFASWYRREAAGPLDAMARLVCPIGGSAVRDKRPAVIAALAASEIMTALLAGRGAGEEAG